MTELWLFEIFGIWYDVVFCGMAWYSWLVSSPKAEKYEILILTM